VLALGPLATACAPAPWSEGEGQGNESVGSTSSASTPPITRSQTIANAEEWVTAKLQYCQSPNGKPDPDPVCASTCTRTSDPAWDPYRSDCSGLISWAWGLAPPGLVTSEFAPFGATASHTIDCVDMKPGDAANRNSGGHIVLFKEWVTPGAKAVFIEEPGCSASEPYAHEFTSDVACSGADAGIAYEATSFTAIRYVAIQDDPDAGGDAAADGGGGSPASSDAGAPAPIAEDGAAPSPPEADAAVGLVDPARASALPANGCAAAPAPARSADGRAAAWLVALIALGSARLRARRRGHA
jgi:hypothetical protein